MNTIKIRGAKTHNLKNIDVDLPRDKLIVITGLSGSGKSSLAFDTIYAEGQRRYVESLSAYARQFLSIMEKPDVEHIEGLSPAISIEQKSTSHNPRSTVGTITEIYDYLRLLYARVGTPICPKHNENLEAQTISQMVDQVLARPEGDKLLLVAPIIRGRKGEHTQIIKALISQGFIRVRIDNTIYDLQETPKLDKKKKHTIEAIVDRFKVRKDIGLRLSESFETALRLADGLAWIMSMDDDDREKMIFSNKFACPICDYSLSELEPRLFSFNNPVGACSACDGLGFNQFIDPKKMIKGELSLTKGAIRGWDAKTNYYFQMIQCLAKHYHFDIDKPFNTLSKSIQDLLLYGSGKDTILFKYQGLSGNSSAREQPFAGIIPTLQRRFRESESNAVRDEILKYMSTQHCPECQGHRLNTYARNVFINHLNLPQICALPITEMHALFSTLKLPGVKGEIARKIIKEIVLRSRFLVDVGLNYLTLARSADTLSGGEAQRIRLASQIGAGLVGVMYVLDEPSIGLHQRDNERLLKTLLHLRDLGNTVIVVEHDEEAIRLADHVIDIGPGAGEHGGEIVAFGTPQDIENNTHSLTGKFLSKVEKIEIPKTRLKVDLKNKVIKINKAAGNNLKNIDVAIPLGVMTCITGVSGSGKSTLINDTLYPFAATALNRADLRNIASFKSIEGLQQLDKVIDVNQGPIGRTPRSNPATYTGLFTPIRELFAATPEARSRGYTPGRFSFNVKGGRCEACQGDGVLKVAMHFLPDIYVLCDICYGKRYNRETLGIKYKTKNISEVLEMTIEEANGFFSAIPNIAKKTQALLDVGLAYIKLGQNATTLSGGEAQRVKLAKELAKRSTGKTLYIFDEPTTGLHFQDIRQLLAVFFRLKEQGNTLVVIEHNLDVIKTADWIIDLGPEGGDAGGEIIATGTPEEISKLRDSHTGRFLVELLK